MQIDVKRYASEIMFHAAVAQAWEVSEAEFLAIVAMLNDGTALTMQERADAQAFIAVACEAAAGVDPMACDASAIHRAACEAARRMGVKVRNVSPLGE